MFDPIYVYIDCSKRRRHRLVAINSQRQGSIRNKPELHKIDHCCSLRGIALRLKLLSILCSESVNHVTQRVMRYSLSRVWRTHSAGHYMSIHHFIRKFWRKHILPSRDFNGMESRWWATRQLGRATRRMALHLRFLL
jgi:hypothetical protein